jgi:hypothetical protein
MKKNNVCVTWFVIILLIHVLPEFIFSEKSRRTGFTALQKGETLIRPEFDVSLEISNFNRTTGHYWVAIASVKGHLKSWDRVLKLYTKSKDRHNSTRKELNILISEWQLNLFWPKNHIDKNPYEGVVNDNGKNPLRAMEPQPMVLLIIKVDDKLHNQIRQWFRKGSAENSFPGFPASMLSKRMILARCEIFFDR